MEQLTKSRSGASGFLFYLYIYFLIDFFLHLSQRIPGYGVLRPTLLLVIIISFLLLLNKDRLPKIGSEPAIKAMLWLIAYMIITLPFVKWPGSVLQNIPEYIKAVVYLYFTAWLIDSEKRLGIFLLVFCTCQVFRVLEPLYMYFTEGYLGGATHLGGGEMAARLAGAPSDVVNANGLGFVLVTVIPYLHYLLWKSSKASYKTIYILVMPLLLYALILTMSRGAFLALLVVIWMVFKESKYKMGMILILVSSFFIIWSNLSDIHKDRYISLISTDAKQSATARGRIDGLITEFTIVLDRPIVGHGLGTSGEAKYNAVGDAMISHNLYAEVLLEIGFLGFILYVAFIKSIYKNYKRNRKMLYSEYATENAAFPVRLNMAFGTVFWMYIVFSFNYFGFSVYHWYLFAGLMIAFSRIYCGERPADKNGSHA